MKKRFATMWLGGCSGCHMSFLDLDEFLIELLGQVELVYGPLLDVKEFPQNVDLLLVEGAVANRDNLEMLLKARERSKCLVSFGDCAVTGNVTALRNLHPDLSDLYGGRKQFDPLVPPLLPRVEPLHHYVKVDHYLPGCPPQATRIRAFLQALLEGREPQLESSQRRFG
jgi:NAD-reducing hydrogenase small subunit